MAFTLKVIDDKASGCLISDDRHTLGGIDCTQRAAFNHLFPDGFCDWGLRELLYDLADIHGWRVSMTVREPEPQHNTVHEPHP